MSNKGVFIFCGLAFGYSWVVWETLYWMTDFPIQAVVIMGAFGPSLAGIYMAFRQDGREGVKRLLRRGFRFKMTFKQYAILFGFVPLLFFIAYWWTDGSGALLTERPWLFFPYFIYMMFLGGALQEEFGWRGYLLDVLQANGTPIRANLIVGVIWTVWHVPLFFMNGTGQASLPFWAYFLAVVSYTTLMTWVYNMTRRNVWSALVMHTMFNVMLVMLGLIGAGGYPIGFIHLAIVLFAAALVVTWRTFGQLRYEPLETIVPVPSSVMDVRGVGKDLNALDLEKKE